MIDLTPLFALRLRTPRLELRLGTPDEIDELGVLATQGIHPPEEMPFGVAWTDGIDHPGFGEVFAGFHRDQCESWSPLDWHLDLLVWAEGELVGNQELSAKSFRETRGVSTGSWLGGRSKGAASAPRCEPPSSSSILRPRRRRRDERLARR